jgi:hypothetical protein
MRRRKKQTAWRARNPDYFSGRRIQTRAACHEPPEPLRLPSPLDRLPWDTAAGVFRAEEHFQLILQVFTFRFSISIEAVD